MTVVFKVDEETKNKMIDYYKDKTREKTPPYAIFQATEDDTVITLYESNKVMFQGKNAEVGADMWKTMGNEITSIQKEIEEEFIKDELDYKKFTTIGSDEVGTGDYFGPIVVTATYVSKDQIKYLEDLGIKDSKMINDDIILKIAPQISKTIKYESIVLSNEEYNKNYSEDINMNKIKAILHNKVLEKILKNHTSYDYIVVDQFVNERKYYEYLKDTKTIKNITFLTKAENRCLSVACASIISRYIFLKEIDKISDKLKINIQKGAGELVDKQGKEIVEKYGKEMLTKIAKLNFNNTKKILDQI